MRILSLANVTPYPAHGGVHLRILNLLERIARHHEVTLGCHMWDETDQNGIDELKRRGINAVGSMVRPASVRRHGLQALGAALRGIPPETVQYQTPALRELVRAGNYDLLHVDESILAPYAADCPRGGRIHRVLTLHNIHFVQDRRIAAIEPSAPRRMMKRINAAWMWRYEPAAAATFDRCIAVSEEDRAALLARAPSVAVDVVPNGVDTKTLRPLPEHGGPPSLLFVGSMAYRPCTDAAIWLVREILPLIRAQHPDAEVWIVGKQPPPEVLALAGPGVYVMGAVPDVRPYYGRATMAVVPLRAGGGSRLKILEAMALGRAVVSTTIGAEGLGVVDGHDVALADDPAALAATVNRLLANPDLRRQLEARARATVQARFDWDDLADRQLRIYQALTGADP